MSGTKEKSENANGKLETDYKKGWRFVLVGFITAAAGFGISFKVPVAGGILVFVGTTTLLEGFNKLGLNSYRG